MILAHLPYFFAWRGRFYYFTMPFFLRHEACHDHLRGCKHFSWYGRMLILWGRISDFRFQLMKMTITSHPDFLLKE